MNNFDADQKCSSLMKIARPVTFKIFNTSFLLSFGLP